MITFQAADLLLEIPEVHKAYCAAQNDPEKKQEIFQNVTANRLKYPKRYFLSVTENCIQLQTLSNTYLETQTNTQPPNKRTRSFISYIVSPAEVTKTEQGNLITFLDAIDFEEANEFVGEEIPSELGRFLAANWAEILPNSQEVIDLLQEEGIKVPLAQPSPPKEPLTSRFKKSLQPKEPTLA
jgi:hypothetical protein